MPAIMEVNLDKLPQNIVNLIKALLKATGLEEIPNTINIVSTSYCAYHDIMCYYIELSDGRRFGVDCDEEDWGEYTLFCYKWTEKAIECNYSEFYKCHKIIDVIRIAAENKEIPLHLLVETNLFNKEELKTAVIKAIKGLKVMFTDIEADVKKDGTIMDGEIEISPNGTYIHSVNVMSGNSTYLLWGEGYKRLPIDITIKGMLVKTIVHFPKDLEGVQVS